MAIVPALDLRPQPGPGGHPNDPNAPDERPHNIEAEQALLGILMYDNTALHRMEGKLEPKHFFEPLHQRLFRSILSAIRADLLAEPVTLAEEFRRDGAFQSLGGMAYLADLFDHAPPSANAPDYERVLVQEWQRREVIRFTTEARAACVGALVGPDQERLTVPQIIGSLETDLIGLTRVGRENTMIEIGEAARAAVAYIDNSDPPSGYTTGLNPLDIQLGAMRPGDLLLLAGRPSMGKSAVSLGIGLAVAAPSLADMINEREEPFERLNRAPAGVLQFHGEMNINAGAKGDGGQVTHRMIADIGFAMYGAAFPNYRAIMDKKVSVEQREMIRIVADQLRDVPLLGIKRSMLRLGEIRSMAKRQQLAWQRRGIELGQIIIDHAGLILPDEQTRSLYERTSAVSVGLKALADDMGCSVLALVQLSRDIEKREDKRPQLSDLRDSGRYEEDADAVMFVYRDAYYAKREAEPDVAKDPLGWDKWDRRRKSADVDLIMGKVRAGDAGGTAKLWGGLAHNAIRARAPERHGGML